MIEPRQCRAARALLGWSQRQLADAAGTGLSTIIDFEGGRRQPIRRNMEAIVAALKGAGIVFIEANAGGPGVRLKEIW